MTRFTAETDRAHVAKQEVDWHKVWCGINGNGVYVDIHKFGTFGDRAYSWMFVYTVEDEVIFSWYDITDDQARLPEQELKSLAAQHVATAVSRWKIAKSHAADVAKMRAAKNAD
jgi:hypothetical protein